MADFETAYNRTNGVEGGYVNDLTDPGGETYDGISRRWHPGWPGWKIIDLIKSIDKDWRHKISTDTRLKNLKRDFYLAEFWTPLRLDELNDQDTANEIYDYAVNTGLSNAIKAAQRVEGLTETGKIDDVLIDKLNRIA